MSKKNNSRYHSAAPLSIQAAIEAGIIAAGRTIAAKLGVKPKVVEHALAEGLAKVGFDDILMKGLHESKKMNNSCDHHMMIDEPPRCTTCGANLCAKCKVELVEPVGLCSSCAAQLSNTNKKESHVQSKLERGCPT